MRSFSFVKSPPVLRALALSMVLTLTCGWWGGCERQVARPYVAEADDPGFRRGKELVRQGRNKEALAEFLRVIAERGENAPESHLEVGILYQQHLRDPILAIYHFKKFRELRPGTPQANSAQQQIDACIREFARTLPGQFMENQTRQSELYNENNELRLEINRLKEQLATLSAAQDAGRQALPPLAVDPNRTMTDIPPRQARDTDPVPLVPLSSPSPSAPVYTPPATAYTQPAPATPAPAARRHVVAKGDTLYSLAQRYYGNRSRWRDILAANRDQLSSEHTPLRIGMELRIPQ